MTRLTATIEPDGDGLLVLLPDGEVKHQPTPEAALALVRRWGAARTRRTGETTAVFTDWRRGARPPVQP